MYSPLFLQLLESLSAEVTSHVTLHPGNDLAQTFVTDFLHLTEDTGSEEYLEMIE